MNYNIEVENEDKKHHFNLDRDGFMLQTDQISIDDDDGGETRRNIWIQRETKTPLLFRLK